MTVNQDIIKRVLKLSAKGSGLKRFSEQEIDRIIEVIMDRIKIVNSREDDSKIPNKIEWVNTVRAGLNKDIEDISDFFGLRNLSQHFDLNLLTNTIFEIEFNTDSFIKTNN